MRNRDIKGRFIKGHSLGLRFGNGQSLGISKEKYEKISKAQKGRAFSDEHKKKISISLKGKMTWNKGIKGLLKSNSGSFTSERTAGKNNINWKGGITLEVNKIRNSIEYRLWRKAIFQRDNYTCQICNVKGVNLNAHHLYDFSLIRELRYSLKNGVTLCKDCHKEIHRKNRSLRKIFSQIIKEHKDWLIKEYKDDGFVIGQNI